MNIADRIQHLRKLKGISQEELADKIGVSRQTVSKWESEQSIPDINKVVILSDFFEVTADYLLKGIEEVSKEGDKKRELNANIFAIAGTAINFIGLLVSIWYWYEAQTAEALLIGFIFMTVGCMIFGVGMASATRNVEEAKRKFWMFNVWLLTFIPLSILYNSTLNTASFFWLDLTPYPMMSHGSFVPFIIFWLVYFTIGSTVTFINLKK